MPELVYKGAVYSEPMDPDWKKRVQKANGKNLKRQPALAKLRKKLLAINGEEVLYDREPFLQDLISKGHVIKGKIKMKVGERNSCHWNAAGLYIKHPKTYQIATGFVLSRDPLWRPHSWVMQGSTIIETTERRDIYFGIVLSEEQSKKFIHFLGLE